LSDDCSAVNLIAEKRVELAVLGHSKFGIKRFHKVADFFSQQMIPLRARVNTL
jgi:hypothetical protein